MYVGVTYRVRVKRHHTDGMVNSYPTLTALDFFGQRGTLPIPGLEEINLIAGYEWDREERAMGAPDRTRSDRSGHRPARHRHAS